MAGHCYAAVAVVCFQLFILINAQHDFATTHLMNHDFAELYAVNIEELQILEAEVHERERELLLQNPTSPAAVTIGDSITAFGYSDDGWATRLNRDFPHMAFVVSELSAQCSRVHGPCWLASS